MWRRQREDDGRLQSVIQSLRMTATKHLLPVGRRRGSRRGAQGLYYDARRYVFIV